MLYCNLFIIILYTEELFHSGTTQYHTHKSWLHCVMSKAYECGKCATHCKFRRLFHVWQHTIYMPTQTVASNKLPEENTDERTSCWLLEGDFNCARPLEAAALWSDGCWPPDLRNVGPGSPVLRYCWAICRRKTAVIDTSSMPNVLQTQNDAKYWMTDQTLTS